jgi:hypothetical protein
LDLWNHVSLPNFSSSPRKGGMCFISNELFQVTTGVSQTARLNETWRIGNVLENVELKESDFQIFPNPCSDFCRIEFNTPYSGELFLYSIDGRMVQKFNLTNSDQFEMNTKDFVGGTYILKSETITELLLIQK